MFELTTLQEEFRREESIYHTPLEGRLSIDSFMRVLRRILPTKGEHAMRRLERASEMIFASFFNFVAGSRTGDQREEVCAL